MPAAPHMERPKATCPHCGEQFDRLRSDGTIPTHDFPKPCRSVCRGAGKPPKAREDTPLYKDKPEQEAIDFLEAARAELRLYGFAIVKEMARLQNRASGTMECPLCQQDLKFSVAASNGHCRACCSTAGCIQAME